VSSRKSHPWKRQQTMPRVTVRTAPPQALKAPHELTDGDALDDESLGANQGEAADLDPQWEPLNLGDEESEEVDYDTAQPDEAADGSTPGAYESRDNAFLRYLHEAGRVRLLTTSEEVQYAEHMMQLRGRLRVLLAQCMPQRPNQPEPQAADSDADFGALIQEAGSWIARLLQEGEAMVRRESGMHSGQLRRLWEEMQRVQAALEETRAAGRVSGWTTAKHARWRTLAESCGSVGSGSARSRPRPSPSWAVPRTSDD
jgi:hypothetical protein